MEYTKKHLVDLLTDIVETGSIHYWARYLRVTRNEELDVESAKILDLVELEEGTGEKKKYEITPDTIMKGIEKILSDGFQIRSDIKASIVSDDVDSEAGDCIIQAALFGELIYS